jgi:hypothetical protein
MLETMIEDASARVLEFCAAGEKIGLGYGVNPFAAPITFHSVIANPSRCLPGIR